MVRPQRARRTIRGLRRSRAALGIGKRKIKPRQANSNDIRRKGISLLKRGNASLARFIEARYGAKAIAKYQDYAGRLRRSIRLRKQVVKIDDATFRIKGYIIRTDTAGNNPYSCTCPDFSQFSNDDRNWLSSKAGPFNPCKHMMAVRDRNKGGGKWVCSDGVCTLDPLTTSGYTTKATCEAAVIPPRFTGGQCPISYYLEINIVLRDPNTLLPIGGTSKIFNIPGEVWGPITETFITEDAFGGTAFLNAKDGNGLPFNFTIQGWSPSFKAFETDVYIRTLVPFYGVPDDCGNAAGKCPI